MFSGCFYVFLVAFNALTLLVGRQEKFSDWVLVWLCVWIEVHIVCIWFSWCHCYPKTPSSLATFKSRLVLPFWYRLTQVVLEKRPLKGCSSSSSFFVFGPHHPNAAHRRNPFLCLSTRMSCGKMSKQIDMPFRGRLMWNSPTWRGTFVRACACPLWSMGTMQRCTVAMQSFAKLLWILHSSCELIDDWLQTVLCSTLKHYLLHQLQLMTTF